MNLALALLVCGTPSATTAAAPENFAFQNGTLQGWEGEGFAVAPAGRRGPGPGFAACSGDNGVEGKPASLHRAFTVPAAGGYLKCFAHATISKKASLNGNLDVVLFAAGKRVIPKQTRKGDELVRIASIQPPDAKGRPREYFWDLCPYAGQTLRLALVDQDKRRDCFLVAGGFAIEPADEFEAREFGRFMHQLTEKQKLSPAARFETKHFIAYSNADDEFTVHRMNNCELIYDLFFDHFRKKGFVVREPPTKMMVSIFESQAGFEAYVGQRLPDGVTGMYHTKTNRLVVYDFGTNRSLADAKSQARVAAKRIRHDLDRRRFIETVNRKVSEFRSDANIGTVMHEVAHQLSFNCGLLNRDGDVPFWLAEGLGTYCEATQDGAWQGIGEMNPERLNILAAMVASRARFIPLEMLIERDDWMRDGRTAIVAYSQSWALFRMLMEERPREFRKYMALIHGHKAAGSRLDDFGQAFGKDIARIDLRYQEYMRELAERFGPRKK